MSNSSSNDTNTDVFQIIYVSNANRPMSVADIHEIERAAIEKNSCLGVTGVLVHCNGKFIQVLEGSESSVTHLYAAIESDDRHSNLELLKNQLIPQRQFTDWQMKLIPTDELQKRQGVLYDKLFDINVTSNEAFECAIDSLGLFVEFKQSYCSE